MTDSAFCTSLPQPPCSYSLCSGVCIRQPFMVIPGEGKTSAYDTFDGGNTHYKDDRKFGVTA